MPGKGEKKHRNEAKEIERNMKNNISIQQWQLYPNHIDFDSRTTTNINQMHVTMQARQPFLSL